MAGMDSDYWLEFAKEGISKSIESREKAADKLDTFLTWIWGIYTSVFALASLFNFVSSDIWQLVWVGQPILIIMLARYFCTIVSMPSSNNDANISADPNNVASIIDSFKLIVDDKRKKLKVAKLFALFSIFSLTAALTGYNYCDPNKALKIELQAMKLKKEIDGLELSKVKAQQNVNDSIKSSNDFYDYQLQNIIRTRKLNYLKTNTVKGLDTLKQFEK